MFSISSNAGIIKNTIGGTHLRITDKKKTTRTKVHKALDSAMAAVSHRLCEEQIASFNNSVDIDFLSILEGL